MSFFYVSVPTTCRLPRASISIQAMLTPTERYETRIFPLHLHECVCVCVCYHQAAGTSAVSQFLPRRSARRLQHSRVKRVDTVNVRCMCRIYSLDVYTVPWKHTHSHTPRHTHSFTHTHIDTRQTGRHEEKIRLVKRFEFRRPDNQTEHSKGQQVAGFNIAIGWLNIEGKKELRPVSKSSPSACEDVITKT